MKGFSHGSVVKTPPASVGDSGSNPWVRKSPMEEEMVTCSRTLAWEIPWIEEPGGLQSVGSQRVGHDRATEYIHAHQMFITK